MGAVAAVAVLGLAGGPLPARAASTNPDIQLNQVGATARGAVGVQNLAPVRPAAGLAVAPVPPGGSSGSRAGVLQPLAALDRCEAILRNSAPPVAGLDCSAGQLDQLRRQVEAEAAALPAQTLDVGSLYQNLGWPRSAPEQIDPITGAPLIVLLTPGR